MEGTTTLSYFDNFSEPTNSSNTTNDHQVDLACTLFYDHDGVMMSHVVSLYCSILFVGIGLLGNGLSVLVFTSKDMRSVSSNFYLLALAVSDAIYLLGIFATKILDTMYCLYFRESEINIYHRNRAMCKLLQFVLDLSSDYSMCLVLAFTVERSLAVFAPARFKTMCTVRRAQVVCLLLFCIITSATVAYHFMFMDVIQFEQWTVCTISLGYETIFSTLYVIEMVLFRVLPSFLVGVINVAIIVRVSKLSRKRRHWGTSRNRHKREDKNLQLTIMLIIVSSAHIILYVPVLTHFLLQKLRREGFFPQMPPDPLFIFRNYAQALYVAGHAINFFLYTMSGRVFRDQLQTLLCDKDRNGRCLEKTTELRQLNNNTSTTQI